MNLRWMYAALGILLLCVITVLFFLPVFLTILNSFKSMEEMTRPFYALPLRLNFANYSKVITTTHLPNAFLYSFIIVSVSTAGFVFFSSLAGYAIARRNTLVNRMIFVVLISGLMIPFSVIMIPLMKVLGFLHIANIRGLILVYFGLGMSLPTFIMTGFIKASVPLELEESAFVDGAGNLRIFLSLVLPLCTPALATVITIGTVWVFNDFLLPSLLLTSKQFTVPLSQLQLAGLYQQQWTQMLAGFTIVLVPLILLFISLQRYFIRGVTEGALKG